MSNERKHWIDQWTPDDPVFWERKGKKIAWRNLVWSILAENIGFSVWYMWSAVVPRLPKAGFAYTPYQLFQLVAIPGLMGAMMRFPYTFAVPKFGGRNWTIVSALLLLIPTSLLFVFVRDPSTPFWMMALAAATAGVGGGNFSSSMTNISFFFPDKEKGLALGLNAAGGNVGVSTVQLLVPVVVGLTLLPGASSAAGGGLHLENAALMWLPFIALAAVGAALYMNNLTQAKSNFADQVVVAKRRHTWIMAWLYIGTFGSFAGYAAAFPLLLKTQFPEVTANLTFLGALVSSIARPLGGKLADAKGGARVTFWNFCAITTAAIGLLYATESKNFPMFLVVFLLLFVTTGIGNGSTFRMIPVIFRALHVDEARGRGKDAEAAALVTARRETGAVVGIVAGIGALGGFFIPQSLGSSVKATGSATTALSCFALFYLSCVIVTWWCYLRRSFFMSRRPSLVHAGA